MTKSISGLELALARRGRRDLPVAIKQIKEIRRGRSTETFKVARDRSEQDKCFSIVYLDGGKHANLDLVALSQSDAEAWVTGLGTLIKEMGRANFCRNMINIQSFTQ